MACQSSVKHVYMHVNNQIISLLSVNTLHVSVHLPHFTLQEFWRKMECEEVDVLFPGLLTLKKQKIYEEKMMNISKLSRLLCMVSKERNMDGFPEMLYLQM